MAHARTNRKDDILMQRRLYIDEAHMALDIFRFAVSFLLYSVILGVALTTAAMRPFLRSYVSFYYGLFKFRSSDNFNPHKTRNIPDQVNNIYDAVCNLPDHIYTIPDHKGVILSLM